MTREELQHIAPKLTAIKDKGTGMFVPASYFENFTLEVGEKQTLLKDVTPGLIVPKEYFDSVEDKVFQSLQKDDISFVKTKEQKKTATKRKIKSLWISVAIAASLALFVVLQNPFEKKESITIVDIEMWINEGELDLSSNELAAVLEEDVESLNVENSLNEEEIEEYLLEEMSSFEYY